jgi:hypothetical protein
MLFNGLIPAKVLTISLKLSSIALALALSLALTERLAQKDSA